MKNQPSPGIEGKAEGQGKPPTNKGGGAHNGPRRPQQAPYISAEVWLDSLWACVKSALTWQVEEL